MEASNDPQNPKKRKFPWRPIIAFIMIFGLGITYAMFLPSEQSIATVIQVDYAGKPISKLDDLANGTIWCCYESYVLTPSLESEMAKSDDEDHGNLYAPEILKENGIYKMWYGAQSSAGHDSIHFATSDDGIHWIKYGVVISVGSNNHVNDPSVVHVNNTYYMYYSVAPIAELDQIWVATSPDGLNWTVMGPALVASDNASDFDSLKVGRPTVLYQNNTFKMWFDGSQRNATNPTQVAAGTGRHIGYATSTNGINWTKYSTNPIFLNSGAIDVEYIDNKYVVVEESGDGILWRTGTNETMWESSAQWLFKKTGTSFDTYGHVTPFIMVENGRWVATYTGAAPNRCWCHNRISVWYPFYNLSVQVGSQGIYPWAASKTCISCILNSTHVGESYTIRNCAGTQTISVYSNTVQSGVNAHFILEDGNQIKRF